MPESDPERPSNQDPSSESIDEGEIDRLLQQAAGMTQSIHDEVGHAEPSPGSMADLAAQEQTTAGVDQQLDDIGALLNEVAETPRAGDTKNQPGPPDAASTPDPDDLPSADTVAESISDTAPSGPPIEIIEEDPSPTGESALEATDSGEPPMTTGEPLALDATSGETPDPPADAESARGSRRRLDMSAVRKACSAAATGARSALEQTLSGALTALDAVDGTLAFVSYRLRCALGWVALSLFIAAAAVFASSWLG